MTDSVLYIIGNGFDLFHGVKSSYGSFRKWLQTHDYDTYQTYETVCDYDALWSDFETGMAYVSRDFFLESGLALEWLGFENVVSMDETVKEGEDFQEDLQIHLAENALLIIEVKGLYGTSKDNECSQISKIELRRIHECKYSNVHSLYIVNNERGKEPLKRQVPPFTESQIKDAKYALRAMTYTYQLFNLYFEIETGIISKGEARKAFFQNGLIDFHTNFKSLGTPYDYFKNNKVACIELHDTILSVGNKVYFEDDRMRLNVVEIVNIQVDHQNTQTAKDGKVGIEFNMKIPKGAVLLYKYL